MHQKVVACFGGFNLAQRTQLTLAKSQYQPAGFKFLPSLFLGQRGVANRKFHDFAGRREVVRDGIDGFCWNYWIIESQTDERFAGNHPSKVHRVESVS